MTEIERIEDQMRRAFDGRAWSGPSVMRTLARMSPARAAARPIDDAHSIWEIVLHMAVWKDAVRRRIQGDPFEPTPEEDWPPQGRGQVAWRRAVSRLRLAHKRLLGLVASLDDDRLADPIDPGAQSVYVLLHGVIQHDLYHAGQIVVLRKGRVR